VVEQTGILESGNKAWAEGHLDRQGKRGIAMKGRDEQHLDNIQLTTHIINIQSQKYYIKHTFL